MICTGKDFGGSCWDVCHSISDVDCSGQVGVKEGDLGCEWPASFSVDWVSGEAHLIEDD